MENKKKKLLFIGIVMNSAGTEKSFLSFVNCLDFEKYDADLLLCKNQGLFMELIPKQVNLKFMPEFGELFLLSGKNAFNNMFNTFIKKNPLTFFAILPYFIKIVLNPKKKTKTAIDLFIKMMQKIAPVTEEYEAVLAYWGDRTMFYMIDKVPNAKKKIAWMHFDYSAPKADGALQRDNEIYLKYFKKCDNIINVSTAVDNALKAKFPEIADKCAVIENINNAEFIRQRSLEQESFPDANHFKGIRLLTVARIAEQKGIDMIPEILAKLKADNYNLRWYIIGAGEEFEKEKVINSALQHNVGEMLIFLGETINPYPFMRDCDIYVQPSRFEGKPVVVEEAKIMRCPIVVANYFSAKEQMADGKYGMIADINPDSLYKNIKNLIEDVHLRERFIKTLSAENFGNENGIEKFYEILNG
ncbi:MAG: glycosyltransferase [Oscillospiraceae bacterium]|nr:glycosyltransferase [Oscillospiraceae bacterium]